MIKAAGSPSSAAGPGWLRLWAAWVAATAIGLGGGLVVGLLVLFLLMGALAGAVDSLSVGIGIVLTVPIVLLPAVAGGCLIGAILGIGQWVVLCGVVPWADQWVKPTAMAVAVSAPLSLMMAFPPTSGIPAPIAGCIRLFAYTQVLSGAIIGFYQWLVLSRQIGGSGWWIVACVAGPLLGMSGWWIPDYIPAASTLGLERESLRQAMGGEWFMVVQALVPLLVFGAVTGLTLVLLLARQARR
ncbi:MAG: hypothetical protein M1370_03700, partial [Bacteroidetes bacterium]|nr:hypothetical protein [Bacteroidota bacterium]